MPGASLQEVNRYKGKNYPIMNIHERTLSVLACRVSAVGRRLCAAGQPGVSPAGAPWCARGGGTSAVALGAAGRIAGPCWWPEHRTVSVPQQQRGFVQSAALLDSYVLVENSLQQGKKLGERNVERPGNVCPQQGTQDLLHTRRQKVYSLVKQKDLV